MSRTKSLNHIWTSQWYLNRLERSVASGEYADRDAVTPDVRQVFTQLQGLMDSFDDTVIVSPEAPAPLPAQLKITQIPTQGSRGDHVAILQGRLHEMGFDAGPIDGIFGPKTTAAVQNFQRQVGLAGSGVIGPKTLQGLFITVGRDVNEDSPWLDIARQELNVCQIPGPEANKRIIEYHSFTTLKATSDEVAWCSSFVNWCMHKAGLPGTNSAAARSWLQYGRKLDAPKEGCIAVYWRVSPSSWQGHVGFWVGENRILGGNQSNCVTIATYPRARLLGWRWPY